MNDGFFENRMCIETIDKKIQVMPQPGSSKTIVIKNRFGHDYSLTEQEQTDLIRWFKNNKPEIIYSIVCGNCVRD